MKLRKLIANTALTDIQQLVNLGIPLARIIRDKQLDISHPSLTRLLYQAEQTTDVINTHSNRVYNSLYPEWLDHTSTEVQEQPKDWIYNGDFPHGVWEYDG